MTTVVRSSDATWNAPFREGSPLLQDLIETLASYDVPLSAFDADDFDSVSRASNASHNQVSRASNATHNTVTRASNASWNQVTRSS